MGNLLIVDDEPDILESLEEMFKYESGLDIDVYVAKSATNAVRLLEKIKFDVVMTDIKMPGMNGIELFKLIKENWPKCRVIFLTGYRDFDNLYEIRGYKEVRYLLKSEEDEVLISAVAEAFEEIDKMMQSEMQESEHQSEIKKAQQVDSHGSVHGYHFVVPGNDIGIVDVAAGIHGNTGVAVHEIVQFPGTAAEGADDNPPVYVFPLSGHHTGLHQFQYAVGYHFRVHAQVLFVQECMGYRIRDCADSKLDGGTVLHQFGHVTANLFFHFPERKRIHGFKWVVILVNAVSLADMYLIVAVNHRKAWHNLQKYLFCRIAEIRFMDIVK